jgi:hypothetical protein
VRYQRRAPAPAKAEDAVQAALAEQIERDGGGPARHRLHGGTTVARSSQGGDIDPGGPRYL